MANPPACSYGILTEGQDDDVSWDAVWRGDGRFTSRRVPWVAHDDPVRSLRFHASARQTGRGEAGG